MDPDARLAPEERLLLALGRLDPPGGARDRAAAAIGAASFRWPRALELASYHRVHALLARNLDQPGLRDLVPDDTRAMLLRMRMAAELRNERYLHAAAEPLGRLARDGIPVLLLKGAALIATVYPAGSRPLNDVDLLIRPEDYPRVARVLEEAGFERVRRDDRPDDEMLRDEHEATFTKRVRNETLALDLHWRVLARDRTTAMSALGYDIPVAELLARARSVELGPVRALVPSAEDLFVHAATQIGIDGLHAHLGRLADLDAIIRSGVDRERLVAIAGKARAAGITHLALSLARMLGAHVPEAALARLRAACPGCGIASRAAAMPSFPFERLRTAARVALIPFLLARRWHRLLYAVTLVLPTRRTARMHVLHPPGSPEEHVHRGRAALLAAGCVMLLLAQWMAEAAGLRGLGARLRARLWRKPAAAEREPAEQRELAAV